jgi:CRISPR-associated exonuclease Cas4
MALSGDPPVDVDPGSIGGSWVSSYLICHRELWLMSHAMLPDEDDPNLEYGRFVHERALLREGRELSLGASRVDRIWERNGALLVLEVKKTSRAMQSARVQLAHYLYQLELLGVCARGELRVPEERRREEVILTSDLKSDLMALYAGIQAVINLSQPPPVQRIAWCRLCAYRDFCWS